MQNKPMLALHRPTDENGDILQSGLANRGRQIHTDIAKRYALCGLINDKPHGAFFLMSHHINNATLKALVSHTGHSE